MLPNEIQFNVFIHFFPNLNRYSVQFKCNTLDDFLESSFLDFKQRKIQKE
jgi:hypothetical protein